MITHAPIYDSSYRTKGMDIVALARDYLAKNAAESGADVLIADLVTEVEKLRDALQTAEDADQQSRQLRGARARDGARVLR